MNAYERARGNSQCGSVRGLLLFTNLNSHQVAQARGFQTVAFKTVCYLCTTKTWHMLELAV